jgi:hypothetical protein
MTFDFPFLREMASAAPAIVYLCATIVLWRSYINLQSRHEAMLEKCVQALTRVNDFLDKDPHESH